MNPLSWSRRIRRFDAFVGRDSSIPRGNIPRDTIPLEPGEGIPIGEITIDTKTGRILNDKEVVAEQIPLSKGT
jgi:hypothetical protein